MADPIDPHTTSRIADCTLVKLARHHHENGNLTVLENCTQMPVEFVRVFYIYDVPAGADRGGHSHYRCHQLLVAISGSFDVTLDDGHQTRTVTLNRPFQALHITPGIWRTMQNFSSGSVCLVLASEHFDESDYVRQYEDFLQLTANKRP
ncbi:MAG: WxcM-like domain-containing protein [Muribaculaceae bacterium]|nr:WxcM-like domain-containing protein [Muribaculaceae bacterium]